MEENMQEQISNTPMQAAVPAQPPVKLWTPGFIAGVCFLLGFPAGIVLASINWTRMKMNDKAMMHLIGGGIVTLIFVLLLILTPSAVGRVVGIAFNLGALFYLQQQMKKDQETFQLSTKVEKAGELGGCLIGLGILLAFLVVVVVLVFGLSMVGVPLPE
jgi:hypothetical protein